MTSVRTPIPNSSAWVFIADYLGVHRHRPQLNDVADQFALSTHRSSIYLGNTFSQALHSQFRSQHQEHHE